MTDAPGWYYTEAGFLYAENEDECEVIAYEYEFEEWMMHTYDIDTDVVENDNHHFWLYYGTKKNFDEFYKHLSCKP